jgi:photosystem II stability/assembly factor-like uncharacterized protein
MGANQSQIISQSKSCLNGNIKNTPVFVTESTNSDGSESTTISLSNFDGCSYNRTITIDKSLNSKNLVYSVFYSSEDGSNVKKQIYDLEEGFTNAEESIIGEKTRGAPVTNDFPFVKESIPDYNKNYIYSLGTIVDYENELYRLTTFVGSNDHDPVKFPDYWTKVISVTNSTEPNKPRVLPLAPLPEAESPGPISPDVILNVGGPSWGQYVIKPSLVPNSIILGSSIMAGFTRIVVADQAVTYSDNTMYRLGDVINYNNNNYLNLSHNDYRGPSFSGSTKVSPDKDGNVWKQVKLVLPPLVPGKINVTSATYGLNCNANLKDNRTTLFRRLTDNQVKVKYNYDYTKTGGDPAGGCDKELEIVYNCGSGEPDKRINLSAEAGNGGLVNFNCMPPPPITNKSFKFNDLKSGILVAWFDANDINADGSKVANGTQITTWKDKTPNNNDAVKGNWGNPPIVVANGLNKLSVLDLQGKTQLSFSLNAVVTTYTIFSVQFGKGPYSEFQRLLHGQSGGDGRLLYGLYSKNGTWMTGFGNDKWTDLNKNMPEEGTSDKWSFADVIVNVSQNTALPSFNGNIQNQKNMVLSGFDSMTIGCKNGGGQPWNGLVAEVLVFTGTINDDERKLIQGYLAWKWGLQDNLPDEHSYKYVNTKVLPDPIPQITDKTFTFSSIKSANLVGWYDANDIYGNGSTLSDGSEIKTWVDKSNNNNDAINVSSKSKPSILANKINNLSVLDLKGSTILNVSFSNKLEKYSIFSVQFSKGEYNNWQRLINGQSNGDKKMLYGLHNGTDVWMTGLGNNDWNDLNKNQPEQNTNDKWYLTDVTVDTTTNTTVPNFNGYLQNTKTSQVGGFDSLTIGSFNGEQPWKGLVAEILVFDGVISNQERQQVQSYLANKWDLQKKLSIYHPYKYINMKVLPNPVQEVTNKTFNFTDIKSGELVAWFDGNDPKGDGLVISNGTTITTWKDKSINENDAIKGSWGNPSIVLTNNLNKLSVIDLQGTTQLNFSVGSKLTKYTIFSVQFSKGPYGDWQRLLHGQNGGDGKLLYGLTAGTNKWMTGFGNGNWIDLTPNTPEKNTDGVWIFTDVVVDVLQNTALPSYNGTPQNMKKMALDGFDSMIIGCQSGGVQPWRGYVGEILVFNGLINDSDRQMIQGYLATKWGLQKSLSKTHPYKYINMKFLPEATSVKEVIDQTFKFTDIKTGELVAWFDGNDPNGDGSIISNRATITTWKDKSINDNDAVKASWGNPPIVLTDNLNKLSVIDLQGTTQLNFPLGSKLTKYTIFSVQFSKGPYSDWQRLLHGQSGADGRLLYGLTGGTNKWLTGFGNGNWIDLASHTPERNTDGVWIFTDVVVDVPQNTASPSYNGTPQNVKKMALDGFDSMIIGCQSGGVQPWRGYVAEILVFNGLINDNERQMIQGYLATKWGLQKSLSKKHLYKYINMKVLPNPPRIPKLVGWFDGGDIKGDGSVFPAESKINIWYDKSPSKNNMIAQIAGTYDSDSKSVNFNSSWYRAERNIKAYPIDVYMVVKLKSLTSPVDVFGYGQNSSDNFNSLTFGEFKSGTWHNGSSGFSRTRNAAANETEKSGEFLLIQWSIANKNFYIYRNGRKIMSSNEYTWDPQTPYFQLGNRFFTNVGNLFQGNIAEVQIFNGQLNDEKRQNLEGALAKKWKIDYYLPDGHPFKSKTPPPKIPEFFQTTLVSKQTPYVSMSKDGKYIAVSVYRVNIYLSSDYGVTWKSLRDGKQHPVNNYTSVFISTDAKIMVINGWATLFYSTDQGTTWNESVRNDAYGNLTVSYPSNIVGSDDGSVLYGGGYRVCKSVDGGKTWNVISEIGLNEGDLCINFACSADGSFIIFTRRDGSGAGRPFLSRDFGKSWTATTLSKLYIQKIFCSKDGKTIALSAYDNGANPTIYVSTDNGNTWTPKTTLQPKFKAASGFGMSGDGLTMIFGGQDWWGGPKNIVISKDLGNTWSKVKAPEYNWEYFASSFDGSIIVGAPFNRDRTNDYVSIYKSSSEGFTNIIRENKNCILPNKKYIDGILNEKINSDGSVTTTITIPSFDKCKSGRTITITVSSNMKKLVLKNNFTNADGNNITETYHYKIYKNDMEYYNRCITIIGIFIILCLLILYVYKRRKTLLMIN